MTNSHQLRLDFQTMSGFVTASKGTCTDYLTAKGFSENKFSQVFSHLLIFSHIFSQAKLERLFPLSAGPTPTTTVSIQMLIIYGWAKLVLKDDDHNNI